MAMKVIQKQKVLETEMLTQFIRELKIQTYLNHPNIVKIFGFFDDR
jgi:aurora kinase